MPLSCKVCGTPLPDGVEFFCEQCRKGLYPQWKIEFVEVESRRGVSYCDAYASVNGDKKRVYRHPR